MPTSADQARRSANSTPRSPIFLALGGLLGVLLVMFGATLARVSGNSMAPSLQGGDVVVMVRPALDSLVWRRASYRVGDVVALRAPGRAGLALKRVVAVGPGTVAVREGVLLVDSVPSLVGSFPGYQLHGNLAPVSVAAGELFVVGDNRRPLASNDSRNFGPLPASDVRGRVVSDLAWPRAGRAGRALDP